MVVLLIRIKKSVILWWPVDQGTLLISASPNCGVVGVKFGFEQLSSVGVWLLKPFYPAISHFCGMFGRAP
jgi:hypothetical protein